jgi:SOS response regulatory protein OraA/RecX
MKSALEKALDLLARRSRTELELDRALERAKFPATERKVALARLRELGYMDDREVARGRARTLIGRGDAPRLAARRLAAQGIAPQDAQAAVAEASGEADDQELARKALQRRLRGREPAGEREKRRLLRALIAKGHKPGAAARALGIEWEGDDEIDD